MSAAELQVMDVGPMLRGWVRDKTYQQCPVGNAARRYLAALRWEGKSARTIESYEHTLAYLALEHSDFELEDFCDPSGVEYVRDYLSNHWGSSRPNTKAQRHSALKGFFAWAVEEGLLSWTPMKNINAPRKEDHERPPMPSDHFLQLLDMQPLLRDRCALQLLGRVALRKNELRELRVGEIDLARGVVQIHGKGDKVRLMPLGFKSLQDDLYLHIQGDARKPDEYLVYPRFRKQEPMEDSTIHRWFKRCLDRAGLPDYEMHSLRHLAADSLYRATGDLLLASKLLRHKNVSTTQVYLHPTRDDLAAAMGGMDSGWRQ